MSGVILDLCSGSGAWSKPYADAGYTVIHVDPEVNGQDVRLFHKPTQPIHGILAAPPCTVFSLSGNRWHRTDDDYREGLAVVDACLRLVTVCRPAWWALENPRGKLKRWLGQPALYFDPCDYGDPYRKRTVLWGDFTLPERTPVEPHLGSLMHRMAGRKKRERAVTPAGFARAFFLANP